MGNLTQATGIRTMERLVQGTAVNSTSGTSIDFTGIPSWAKRITVMFNGVSTSGNSNVSVRLGSGSIQTSGYLGASSCFAGGSVGNTYNLSDGFNLNEIPSASSVRNGSIILTNLVTNIWTAQSNVSKSDTTVVSLMSGSVTLSGTLDRIRITTANGTDTFDAGQINIMYEG